MIDLEALLLKLYVDADHMRRVVDLGLKEENVAALNEDAAAVFRTARGWFQRTGSPVPIEVLTEDHEQYVKVNQDAEEMEPDPTWVVKKLQGQYLRSQFSRRAEKAKHDGAFDGEMEYEEVLDKAKEFVRDLMRITVNSTAEKALLPMSEGMEGFVESTLSWEEDVQSGKIKAPVSFGFDQIDAMYQGIRRGELAIYAAYLKVGKTHLVCRSALKAAMSGNKVALFALEPSEESCYAILSALAARLPMSHVEEKTLPPMNGERERFRALVGDEVFERIFLKHPVGKSARTMEEMYWQAYDVGADLLVGDQLSHVWQDGKKNDADWIIEGEKALVARQLSGEANIASIWAAQLNRGAKSKKDPASADLARSLGIAQGADFMFYLSKVDGNPDLRNLACREPRRGPVGVWELAFMFDPMVIEVTRQITV